MVVTRSHGPASCCEILPPSLGPVLRPVCTFPPNLSSLPAAYPAANQNNALDSSQLLILLNGTPISSTNTMNGVQRFLSRREKQHAEKRKSKEAARSKVRSVSATSLTPLLCPNCHAPSRDWQYRRRRQSSSLESRYDKLSAVLRASVGDSLPFLYAPCRALFTSSFVQVSTVDSSDNLLPQSRLTPQVSPNLYTIFTNEDSKTTASKEAEKNVRWPRQHSTGGALTVAGHNAAFATAGCRNSETWERAS